MMRKIRLMGHSEKKQYIMRNSEGEDKGDRTFKAIMAEKFPNLRRELDIQIQED